MTGILEMVGAYIKPLLSGVSVSRAPATQPPADFPLPIRELRQALFKHHFAEFGAADACFLR